MTTRIIEEALADVIKAAMAYSVPPESDEAAKIQTARLNNAISDFGISFGKAVERQNKIDAAADKFRNLDRQKKISVAAAKFRTLG